MTQQPEERVALVCSYCGSDDILIENAINPHEAVRKEERE